MIRWLVFALCLPGCINRVPTADPDSDGGLPDERVTDAAVADAGADAADPNAPRRTVYDPRARVEATPTRAVFQPGANNEVMQGGNHQLLWLGDRYALLWLQNVRGRIHLVGRTLWSDGRMSDLRRLTTEEANAPRSPDQAVALWSDGRLVVSLSVDGGLWLQTFDRDLRPTGPLVQTRAGRPNDHLGIWHLRATEAGLDVVGAWSSERYQPALLQLAADGTLRGGPRAMLSDVAYPAVGDLWPTAQGYALLWGQRAAAEPDQVLVSQHAADGTLVGTPVPIYVSENNILQRAGPAAPVVLLRDLDAGLVVLTLAGDEVQHTLVVPEIADSVVGAPAPTAPQLGLAVAEGVYADTNPLPTRVVFRAVDYATDTVGPALPISAEDGSCLEAMSLVAGGDRLGVAWALGCSQRRLYFREVKLAD